MIFLTSVSWAENDDYVAIEKGLKVYGDKVKKLKQHIDNSVFQDQEILIELDFDAKQLIDFVQEKIAFQPYQGLLRGVQGTLNSRAGNALDQSVLLAKMLNDAGLDARIATGELSDQQTLQLLSTMANAEIPSQIGKGVGFEQALKALTTQAHEPVEWSKTATYARYQASLKDLSQILQNSNMVLNKKDLTQQLVQQNKTYFWVQYRSNPTDQWHDAHPAFNKTISNTTEIKPNLITHFDGSVPANYHHRLKIEAFIEQRLGTNFKQHRLMEPWIKPVANLQDHLITYSNAPSGVTLKDDYDLAQILDKSHFFIPTFNGNQVGGKVFDTKGRLVDIDAMND
ncbi:MAG: transglutaminase domain-containing protein, partial [Proteobacteria bacterium]